MLQSRRNKYFLPKGKQCQSYSLVVAAGAKNSHGCAKAAAVDILADVAMVEEAVPLLPSSPHLLPRLLDNDATIFIIVIVGPCRQDGGGGEEATTPIDAPATAHRGKRNSGNQRVPFLPPRLQHLL